MVDTIFKLDLKDKKILYELMQNARFSYSTIGKNVGLSREMVHYKVNRMIKEGVIEGFTTSVFRPAVGLNMHYLALIKLEVPNSEKERIIEELALNDNILVVYETEGWFNLYVMFCSVNRHHSWEIFEFIRKTCKLTDNFEFATIIKQVPTNEFFFLEDTEFNSPKINYKDAFQNLILKNRKRKEELVRLDDKDLEILEDLKNNSRKPIKEIAKRIKIATDTVKSKIIKMIKEGVIFSFIPLLNVERLGYSHYILFLRLVENEQMKEVLANIRSDRKAYLEVSQIGKWNYIFFLYSKDHNAVKDFISDLLEKFPETVSKYDLLWIVKKHKVNSYPNLKKVYNLANKS